MLLRSTRSASSTVSWREAVLKGIAPDGGLYLPVTLPRLTPHQVEPLRGVSFATLAEEIARIFLEDEVPSDELHRICRDAFTFDLRMVPLDPYTHVVELFHGPTCAFKDFGARFMARLFAYFWGKRDEPLTVLTATSGDTGSAVAHAFYDTAPNPAIRVAVLYPKDKVSDVQRKQMTTLGHNVYAYEVDGTFDDCQALVKTALTDSELAKHSALTSANSINIARLLPQVFYHAWTLVQPPSGVSPLLTVPSGNLGNLTGGILAVLSGVGSAEFIAAHNMNRTFPEYLAQGSYRPELSRETISNAMDVGNPGNFERLAALFRGDWGRMRGMISGYSIPDATTRTAIRSWYESTGYILDPHTAVGVAALEEHRMRSRARERAGFVFSTAHPAKFSSVVEDAIGKAPAMPPQLAAVLQKEERCIPVEKSYETFKDAFQNGPQGFRPA